MKAWELQGFGIDNLKFVETPIPTPGPNEALVRMSAVSLNYRDKLVVEGLYNRNIAFPIIQGADGVGEIVQLGRDATRFRTGDRVMTHYATSWIDGDPRGDELTHTLGSTISGALAEYLVLSEQSLVRVPDYLSDEEASTLPCAALTAWYALVEKGQLHTNQTVLIQGTGGVSIFGLQIASAIGAKTIVTSSSDEKLARAGALGANYGINYVNTPDWEKTVHTLTEQKGVDHILEVAGGRSLIQSLTAIKVGGHIAVIGLLDGLTSDLPLFSILGKQAVLRGYSVGSRRAFDDMIQAFTKKQLHPVIDTIYPFADTLLAYEHLYRGAFGKIVIRVDE